MAASAQDVVIELILRYIGGSKLNASGKLDVSGDRVAVQSTSLKLIAAELSKYGKNITDIRNSILKNPKGNVTLKSTANVKALKARIKPE